MATPQPGGSEISQIENVAAAYRAARARAGTRSTLRLRWTARRPAGRSQDPLTLARRKAIRDELACRGAQQ
jgi:hypothetical protein